jgi:hypothetical protein
VRRGNINVSGVRGQAQYLWLREDDQHNTLDLTAAVRESIDIILRGLNSRE